MSASPNSPDPKVRLAAYRSTALNDAQHASAAARVAELVLAVPPVNAHEARVMASFVSRFLADVMPPGGGDPDEWLTEVHLARWTAQALGGQLAPGTVALVAKNVRRVVRVKDGLPGKPGRTVHVRRARPVVDLDVLAPAVAGDPAATAALVAGLGAGVTGAAAEGAVVEQTDGGLVLRTTGGDRLPLHNGTAHLAATAVGTPVTTAGRQRLVELATAAGVTLTHQAVRDAWTVGVLSTLPYLEAVALGIGKKRIDWAAEHLERPPAGTVKDMLRGPG
jgi:hypothetical protein